MQHIIIICMNICRVVLVKPDRFSAPFLFHVLFHVHLERLFFITLIIHLWYLECWNTYVISRNILLIVFSIAQFPNITVEISLHYYVITHIFFNPSECIHLQIRSFCVMLPPCPGCPPPSLG